PPDGRPSGGAPGSAAGRRAPWRAVRPRSTIVPRVDRWIAQAAEQIAARAERDLAALVAVSSPSGDARGAEECIAVARALAPERATFERLPCSSPDHADDLLIRLRGTGRGRLLLLGHLDTVV